MQQELALRSTAEIVEAFKVPRKEYDEEAIIESLRQLYRYVPLASEAWKKPWEIDRLVREWFRLKVGETYPPLSKDIYQLQTPVEIDLSKLKIAEENGRTYGDRGRLTKVNIQTFFRANINDTAASQEFEYVRERERYKFKLTSSIPRIPSEVKEEAKKAKALPHKIYAQALENEVLSDLIMECPRYVPSLQHAAVLVLWKPKPSDLQLEVSVERLDKDPLLVLDYPFFEPHLAAMWVEPGEDPFLESLPFYKARSGKPDYITT